MRPVYVNGAWAIAACAAIQAVAMGTDTLRLLALPFAGLALWRLAEAAGPAVARRMPSTVRVTLPPLLITLATIALYHPLLRGDMPLNHDHPVFLLRAWTVSQHVSPLGVMGFETGQMAGMPADGYYPVGTDLLVIGVRLLSAGSLSWDAAYCLTLLVTLLAYPLALYALGKRMGGWLAGLAAGLLGLVDRGAWLQSGWEFTANWGAVAMGLSFAVCLWAIWAWDRLLERASVPAVITAGVVTSIAILCHPMAVAFLGVCVPLMLAVRGLADGPRSIWSGLPALAAAGALVLALPAFWLFPFLARQDWYGANAYAWRPFEEAVRGLLSGGVLNAFPPLVLFSGMAGLALASRRGVRLALAILIAALLLLFVSTTDFLTLFGLIERFPSLGQLEYERFAYFTRTAFVLGAGLLFAQLAAWMKGAAIAARRPSWRAHGLRLLMLATVAPFALYGVRVLPGPYFIPAKRLDYASQSDLHRALRACGDYLRALPPAEVGRVALLAPKHEHALLLLRVYSGVSVFKVGYTPANVFSGSFGTQDRQVWRAMGVRHVLALGSQDRSDLQEVRRFGRLVLYRLTGADDVFPVFTLRGPGQAALLREAPDQMEFSLSGTEPSTRLVVHRAAYALWHAEQGGRELAIARTSIGEAPAVFMEIAAGDGPLTLKYRAGVPEVVGALLSWLGWLTVAGLVVSVAFRRSRAALMRQLDRRPRWIDAGARLGAAGLAGLAALLFGWRLLAGPPSPYPGREVVANLAHHLSKAEAEIQRGQELKACRPYDGAKLRCPSADWHFVGEVVLQSERVLRQCVWLRPVRDARLSVRFSDVPLGEHLQGNFGLDDLVTPEDRAGPFDVTFSVALDGREVGRFTCPTRQGWHAWEVATPGRQGTRGQVTISTEAAGVAQHDFCFTAATTRDVR